jgi:hypothetical protein
VIAEELDDGGNTLPDDDKVKKEIVALDSEDYFDEADYNSFENSSYDGYNYAGGPRTGYNYSDGSEGAHLCKLCGKCYKSAGSLKNHRSLYHRSEIGKNRLPPLSADATAMDASLGVVDADFVL